MPVSFHTVGRSSQPRITDVESLRALPELEDALWVATAAPIGILRADAGFLAAMDTDGDGRIRSDEVRTAIRWTFSVLADPSGIREGNTTLRLAALASDGDGAIARTAAERVLAAKDATGAAEVTLEQVRAVRADEEARGLSAAGRILPAAGGEDADLVGLIARMIQVTGGVPHPAGDLALDAAGVQAWLDQGTAWLAWHDEGAVPAEGTSAIRPVGDGTSAASTALAAIDAKLAQYFLLCDAIRLDPDLAARAKVDASNTDLLDPDAATALLAKAPLAPPRADGVLDLDGALNPAWGDAVRALRADVVGPLLGERSTLTRADVDALRGRLAPYREWVAREPAASVGSVGADVLRGQLADTARHARIQELLQASEVAAVVLDGVKLLERAILMQAWLMPFANSFAAMPDLYSMDRDALFEQGVLVMDGRRFELCVKVEDAARAEKFAASSPMFVMFVMVGEKGAAWELQVAVPVTAGERGHLVEGMWGVFLDRDGRELHAQVRKIAVSPISIKEALLAPFRKLGDTVQGMFDKAAASQTDAVSAQATGAAQGAVDQATSAPTSLVAKGEAAKAAAAAPAPLPAAAPAAPAPAAAAPPAPARPGIGGQLPMLLAGAGVAVAAVGGALAYAMEVFWSGAGALAAMVVDLPLIQALGPGLTTVVQVVALPLSVLVLLLGIVLVPGLLYAIPISIATWLRLRRRDIAALLEGSGWAINTRLYLDRGLAVQLTRRPTPPR